VFRLKKPNLDFGYCSIENIFINDFMPMANGIQIKVYLTPEFCSKLIYS